jgi:hypothetical protein
MGNFKPVSVFRRKIIPYYHIVVCMQSAFDFLILYLLQVTYNILFCNREHRINTYAVGSCVVLFMRSLARVEAFLSCSNKMLSPLIQKLLALVFHGCELGVPLAQNYSPKNLLSEIIYTRTFLSTVFSSTEMTDCLTSEMVAISAPVPLL